MVMHTTQCLSSNGYWEEFWYDIRLTHILNSQNINLWALEVLQHEKYFSLIQEKNTGMLVRHLCRSLYSLKWREHLVVEIFPHLSKYFKHPIHDSISIFLVKAHHYESSCNMAHVMSAAISPLIQKKWTEHNKGLWHPLEVQAIKQKEVWKGLMPSSLMSKREASS